MQNILVASQLPQLTTSNSQTLTEDPTSEESAPLTELSLDALRLHVRSLETELARHSHKVYAYRGWQNLLLSVYSLSLLLGPVLDVLDHRKLPELRIYQSVCVIGLPFLWLLSKILLSPSKARACS